MSETIWIHAVAILPIAQLIGPCHTGPAPAEKADSASLREATFSAILYPGGCRFFPEKNKAHFCETYLKKSSKIHLRSIWDPSKIYQKSNHPLVFFFPPGRVILGPAWAHRHQSNGLAIKRGFRRHLQPHGGWILAQPKMPQKQKERNE